MLFCISWYAIGNAMNSLYSFTEKMCGEEIPWFLGIFDPSVAPDLLFYAYIPIIIIALFVGLYIYFNNRHDLSSKLLLTTSVLFTLWVVNIIVQWIASYHSILLGAWQLTAIFEVGLFISVLYLSYVYVFKNDIPHITKIISAICIFIVAVLTPTTINIAGYNMEDCQGIVGPLWQFLYYFFEPLVIILITYIGIYGAYINADKNTKKEIIIFTLGLVSMITIFYLSNLYGEITLIYEFNLWGPLGMVIFLALLGYNIVKFKAFNLSIAGSVLLVLAVSVSAFSLPLVKNPNIYHTVAILTGVFAVITGFFLVKLIHQDQQNQKKIQQLIDLKNEFLSLASHQLRSPISVLLGNAEYIKETGMKNLTPEEDKEITEAIFVGAKKLTNIVTDILSATKMNVLEFEFEQKDLKNVDVVSILEDIVYDNTETAKKKNITLSLNNKVVGHVYVRSNPTFLEQALSIVVVNALTYIKSGSVQISVSNTVNSCDIVVNDTGLGIKEADKPHMFEKFKRGSNAIDSYAYGTGLGLFMTKKIIEAHGSIAKIWFESTEGVGTTFYISLPTISVSSSDQVWSRQLGGPKV